LFTPSLDKSRFGLVLSGAAAAGGREESSPLTVVCVMLLFLRILMASWVRVESTMANLASMTVRGAQGFRWNSHVTFNRVLALVESLD
jgi:hypothetical protein